MEHVIRETLHKILHADHESHLYEDMANFGLSILKSKYGKSASTAILLAIIIIIIIIGCVWLYMCVRRQYWRSKAKKPSFKRSKNITLTAFHNPKMAGRRKSVFKAACAVPETLNNTDTLLKALLEEEHLDFKKLQTTMAKMEFSGREGIAVKILEDAKKKRADKSHQAYEIEMLLVEMLIYKGDFKKALKCDCLKHEEIADSRRPLYKAIIYEMMGNSKMAKNCWEEFGEMRGQFSDIRKYGPFETDVNLENVVDFQDFQKRVQFLKHKIN